MYLFSQLSAQKLFSESEGGAGIPPPPLLPAPPERIRRAKRGVILLQNGFALHSVFPTNKIKILREHGGFLNLFVVDFKVFI